MIDVPWGSDFQLWVTVLEIDCIVSSNSAQLDDVSEVPADQDIHSLDGRYSNVLRIDAISSGQPQGSLRDSERQILLASRSEISTWRGTASI
jgi:hypothetical protein